MTLPSTPRRAGPFYGDGSATQFPFTFKTYAREDIRFEVTPASGDATVKVLDVDYLVFLNTDQVNSPGGYVQYPISGAPLAVGDVAAIGGNLVYSQPTALPEGGAYRARSVETMADRIVMLVQQVAEALGRTFTFPLSEGVIPAFPSISQRANRLLGFDSSGQFIGVLPTAGDATSLAIDLANTSSAIKGDTLIGVKQPFTGAVARTQHDKNAESLTSGDFGSTGAVTATDEAAIQSAAAAADVVGGNKTFRVNSNVSQAIDLGSLSLPTSVLVEDDRFVRDGWKAWHSEGVDAQILLRGRATASGEGPAVTLQNLATTGNRNVSFVHWYGSSSITVASFEHWGYNADGAWYPGREWLGKGTTDTSFRARTRWDGNGTFVFNPNGDPASYKNNPAQGFVDGYIYTINAPLQTGYPSSGKYLFGLHTGKLDLNVELRVQSGARIALQIGSGPTAVDRWGLLQDFPSAGQLTLYDYIAGANKLVFTSGGDTSHTGVFKPATDNTVSLGTAGNRWSVVYAGTGAINTSDAREKEQMRAQLAAEKAAALAIKGSISAFKFKDAVAKKGSAARWHFGVSAQAVAAAFLAQGLDPNAYALFCYDEWPEQSEIRDESGQIVRPHQPAGNRYGIRYDELAMFILAAI